MRKKSEVERLRRESEALQETARLAMQRAQQVRSVKGGLSEWAKAHSVGSPTLEDAPSAPPPAAPAGDEEPPGSAEDENRESLSA